MPFRGEFEAILLYKDYQIHIHNEKEYMCNTILILRHIISKEQNPNTVKEFKPWVNNV
jgi:hypothetical protein